LFFSTSLTYLFSGQQLKKNLEKAWVFSKVQRKNVDMLTDALDRTAVDAWTATLDAYYLDPSKPNPFEEPAPSKLLLPPPLLALTPR
jgi:hypothetical protein